jgi:hypothetical protein
MIGPSTRLPVVPSELNIKILMVAPTTGPLITFPLISSIKVSSPLFDDPPQATKKIVKGRITNALLKTNLLIMKESF